MKTAILWFRKDLRLHDNEALSKAVESADQIIPFYCFEASEFGETSFGFPKTDSFRAQFLIESVEDLRSSLKEKGSNLFIRKGDTAEELKKLISYTGAEMIFAHKDIHSEEKSVEKAVGSIKEVELHYSFGACLYHINDLPHHFKDTPKVFTTFRKGVEKKSKVRELIAVPKQINSPDHLEWGELPSLQDLSLQALAIDSRAAIKAKGGESEALNRLKEYSFETEKLSYYKQSRNGLIGKDYSSKLSLWLWNGCLSPRKIYWEVKEYEKKVKKNQSTYWLIFELIWRDFFKYIALKHGNSIFQLKGIGDSEYNWRVDRNIFDHWAAGETGVPFIDANMRELNQTGFMSNRGRQNVASFLVKELGLDWRMGAEYFESKLIDYDVASNYGNWMYVAGVGNDPRDRYFNIISQAKRYDPKGKYVRLWLEELEPVSDERVHHPWTKSNDLFQEEEKRFPPPMVEPDYWKKHY